MQSTQTTQSNQNDQSGAEIQARHILLIQPITTVAEVIDDQVDAVAKITGLHQYTVRQKLTGESFDILTIDPDLEKLSENCSELKELGFAAAVVDHSSLIPKKRSIRVSAIESGGSSGLTFLDHSGDSVGWLNPEIKAFITIGSLKPELYGVNKAMLGQALGSEVSQAVNDEAQRIIDISRDKPALILQMVGSESQLIIEGGRFSYHTLPGDPDLSAAVNFQALVTHIRENCTAQINVDFGLKPFPYSSLASKPENIEGARNRFSLFSQLAFCGFEQGLSERVNLQAREVSETIETKRESGELSTQEPKLPPSPVAPRRYSHAGLASISDNPLGALRPFGPPVLVVALLIAAFVFPALIPLGLLSCLWSLTMTLRKRAIEQLPTSKIRSMPTGAVEIKGETKRKYALVAPYSLTRCIYYSYQVTTMKSMGVDEYGQERNRWSVVERGDSGSVPFYLKDETDSILVDPKNAIIKAGQTEEYSGDSYAVFSGSKPDSRRRVIETVIAEGAQLYVIGHARPVKNSAKMKRQEYLNRLRVLKADPVAMRKYDTDGDGEVSIEEWAVARAEIEQKMLEESLSVDNIKETVIVGESPGSGLFYISDKGEPEILKSYAWQIPLSAIVGFALLAYAIVGFTK